MQASHCKFSISESLADLQKISLGAYNATESKSDASKPLPIQHFNSAFLKPWLLDKAALMPIDNTDPNSMQASHYQFSISASPFSISAALAELENGSLGAYKSTESKSM